MTRWLAALCLGALGCVRAQGFKCLTDQQCGADGVCEVSHACSLPDPICPGGRRYSDLARGSLANQCVVASEGDGGTDDGSADGALDAAGSDGGGLDGSGSVDAALAADASAPAADIVLGQADFGSATANAFGFTASTGARSLHGPNDVASDGTHLWVTDSLNARVLQWNRLPAAGSAGTPADLVLGQPAMDQNGMRSTGPDTIANPARVTSDGTRLYVTDLGPSRVLWWNSAPTSSGQLADHELGQASLSSVSLSVGGPASFNQPAGVWSDGSRLLVADLGNHRVLLWTSFPTMDGASANQVIGFDNLSSGRNNQVSASDRALTAPSGVLYDGSQLLISDSADQRILGFAGIPTVNGAAASYVIGQSSFTATAAHTGPSGFTGPVALSQGSGVVVVADAGNRRVLVFTAPLAFGAQARAVLGQDDFVSGGPTTTPNARRFGTVGGVAVAGGRVWVADPSWNRVVGIPLP